MRVVDLYRGLLFLYPVSFRNQFSEEMISVFQGRAAERSGTFKFFIRSFSSIAKGACIMWLAKILAVNRNPSPSEAADATSRFSHLRDSHHNVYVGYGTRAASPYARSLSRATCVRR
jgi:hypothetical protein